MGVNESATFTLTTTVAASAAGQTINNTAVVSTSTSETTTSNNQDSEPISVEVAVLPPTGGYIWNRLAIAAGLVLAGFALVAVDRLAGSSRDVTARDAEARPPPGPWPQRRFNPHSFQWVTAGAGLRGAMPNEPVG